MLRSKLIPMLLLVGMMAIITGVVLANGGNDDPSSIDPSQVKEDVVKALIDSEGKVINSNKRMAKAARDHEGGLGGWYFSDDFDTVYIFMEDITKSVAAREAFEAAFSGNLDPTNTVIVEGAYSLDDLVEWDHQLADALPRAGIYWKGIGVDPAKNVIVVEFASADSFEAAHRVREELEIPQDAVEFNEIGENRLRGDGEGLREEWRPLVGGIQHEVDEGQICTIGFVTERDGEEAFIMASHCTNIYDDIGILEGETVHQQYNPLIGSKVVGEETIDPALEELDHAHCVYNYECRYSEASYAEVDSDEDVDLGMIAKPEDYGSITVNPSFETLEIGYERSSIHTGLEIEWVGRTTGWQKAEITRTCMPFEAEEPGYNDLGTMILCTGKAQPLSGYDGPADGDSGAPVFVRDGDEVELIGTLFAGNDTYLQFSKIGFIYMEIDNSASWDTCTSGC